MLPVGHHLYSRSAAAAAATARRISQQPPPARRFLLRSPRTRKQKRLRVIKAGFFSPSDCRCSLARLEMGHAVKCIPGSTLPRCKGDVYVWEVWEEARKRPANVRRREILPGAVVRDRDGRNVQLAPLPPHMSRDVLCCSDGSLWEKKPNVF